jgi:hypothetical protein
MILERELPANHSGFGVAQALWAQSKSGEAGASPPFPDARSGNLRRTTASPITLGFSLPRASPVVSERVRTDARDLL